LALLMALSCLTLLAEIIIEAIQALVTKATNGLSACIAPSGTVVRRMLFLVEQDFEIVVARIVCRLCTVTLDTG